MLVPYELVIIFQKHGVSVFSTADFNCALIEAGSRHNTSWYMRRGYIRQVVVRSGGMQCRQIDSNMYVLTVKSVTICQDYIIRHALEQVNL